MLIFNVDRRQFVLVRQFRAPVHLANLRTNPRGHPPPHPRNAFTIEICAGLADKPGNSIPQTAKEEVLEECGYDVPVEALQLVNVVRGSVGLVGNTHYYFYCEVTDAQRVGPGGGLADEDIEVLHMGVEETVELLAKPPVPKTASLMCVGVARVGCCEAVCPEFLTRVDPVVNPASLWSGG